MKNFIVILAAIILLIICGLHIYWACGGRRGAEVAMPTDKYGNVKFEPKPWMILTIAFMIFVASLVLVCNFMGLAVPLLRLLTYACFLVFLFRGLCSIFRYLVGRKNKEAMNRKLKYEICCFAPVCLIIALGFLFYI